MSKELQKVINSYSDLLIKVLESSCSDKLFVEVLKSIDEFHQEIDKGLFQ